MRIVIDLQGAQGASRFRGIGRYSMSLALAIARRAEEHEVFIVLNGAMHESIHDICHAFEGLIPQGHIRVFEPPGPVAEMDSENGWRARVAELIREHAISELSADAVLCTSLFEGFFDDGVASIGKYYQGDKTAVVLYDLIPMLDPKNYLSTSNLRRYYARKIDSLMNAGLLLAISEHTRQEAIDTLEFDPARIVNISAAVDQSFKVQRHSSSEVEALKSRYGISSKFIMYAPGGFDIRKNIDGLIAAYGLLPADVRRDYQLVIVSKIGDHQRATVLDIAKLSGLRIGELVLTGYVGDQDLRSLYSLAELFVFPSAYEGFGLPALEAMACGAAVIGSSTTSVPEVIGCAEALFDPASPESIANLMERALRDSVFRERLREHGRVQAAKFSWDESAMRVLRALEAHQRAPTADILTSPKIAVARRRLAFVSPVPPERTGIAKASAELLVGLVAHFEIELISDQPHTALPDVLASLPIRSSAWFAVHGSEYDRIVYQFGNSPFHTHMFALLRKYPGVVVLHDFFLSEVLAYEEVSGRIRGVWTQALYDSHGYPALRARHGANGIAYAKQVYPSNLEVLQLARGVIVHSEYPRRLANEWYGASADNWRVIPLVRGVVAESDPAGARSTLGIRRDAFVICSFGFVDPTKLSHRLLDAWLASQLRTDPACHLIFVGGNHTGPYGARLQERVLQSGMEGRVQITEWVDDATYDLYLQAADMCVQLRTMSRGETSAAALDCLNHAQPTIVNANGSMADFPTDVVWKLQDEFEDSELVTALEMLWRDEGLRSRLGSAAQQLISKMHSPAHCAQQYAAAIADFYTEGDVHALLQSIAAVPGLPTDTSALNAVAQSVAASTVAPMRPVQLLVDVSAIALSDIKTGIQRVVRAQVVELLKMPRQGFRIEPVYLSELNGKWQYRYARKYTANLIGINAGALEDRVVDVGFGDIFYSPDFNPGGVIAAAKSGIYRNWRARGVTVNFLVFDLLPLLRPEFFPYSAFQLHADWVDAIGVEADQLICISQTVANELRSWFVQTGRTGVSDLTISSAHLGADIAASAPSVGLPTEAMLKLERIESVPSFLMVGTVEPRKGHLQTIAAFDLLWRRGIEANLIVVGNEGWTAYPQDQRRTIPAIVERLQNHPQLGKRLFWMQGISDEYLERVYAASACLVFATEGEGFGLPLIEAAQHGLPIIARDIPVLREVAQNFAHYFSGLNPEDLASAIESWLALCEGGRAPDSAGMRWRTWEQNVEELIVLLSAPRTRHMEMRDIYA